MLERAKREKSDLHLARYAVTQDDWPGGVKGPQETMRTTAGIAVVVFTGLSNKNAERLRQDGACAFLEKSELGLDKGSETFLAALAEILRGLGLAVPDGQSNRARVGS